MCKVFLDLQWTERINIFCRTCKTFVLRNAVKNLDTSNIPICYKSCRVVKGVDIL
jgi:hypothetical protein